MALVKLTFDGAINTAKNDAIFNYYLVNKVNGIFYDLGGRISPGVSNGKITFADGFVSIYGRRVYVEKDTSVTVTLDSSAYGIVVIRADTSANTVTLELKEAASSYPSLTQTNLLEEEGVFELPVCYYRKTASSLTVDTSPLVYIRTDKDQLDSAKDEINGTIGSKQYGIKTDYIAYNSYSDGKHTFHLTSLAEKDTKLVSFYICNNLVTFNLTILGGYSCVTFTYIYLGTTYKGTLTLSNNILTLTAGDTSHKVKGIYVSY